jgi:hypothetical protein
VVAVPAVVAEQNRWPVLVVDEDVEISIVVVVPVR